YEPVPFVSGSRALAHLCEVRPALLVTDLLMPGMSGRELIRRVRQVYADTLPIAVMSASVNQGAVADLPIQAYLSKPFDLDELGAIIARCIGAEATAQPVTGNLRVHRSY
ncbi:MAG: response regulator, partial [Ktedonobacterales bacterium]|nr:response regulator [Ktedonobacterales bacterium]